MINNKHILLILLCMVYLIFYSGRDVNQPGIFKPATNDHYNYIAINEVLMYVSNNGDGSHDPVTDGNGFYWPGGINARDAAIFEDGLVWGCVANGDTFVNGNTHFQGLQAGKILSPGIADDPSDSKYRVYKIRKNWENHPLEEERLAYQKDYNEWPVEDGAPWVDVDGDGIFTRGIDTPEFVGDEVLWYVSNDLDSARSLGTYGSPPLGLEFQTTVWGFNKKGFLGDVVFKKYRVINKSMSYINEMYLTYWTDVDLGDASDDYVGCDTLLNLGFVFNGDNQDGNGAGITYGFNPPAVGHMFIQGPIVPGAPTDQAKFNNQWLSGYKNLPISAFVRIISPNTAFKDPSRSYQGTHEFFNYIRGYVWNGRPFIDPHTGEEVKFTVPGDPVTREGWYEGDGFPGGEDPDDRRYIMSSGPFRMTPFDTQEVVIAIQMARGKDHIDSINELKKACRSVQIAYDNDFDTTPVMDKPILKSIGNDRSVTLYWDMKTENFDVTDLILTGLDVEDQTYTFEGYRVWQFRDEFGTDPRLVATYDIKNDVTQIYDWYEIDGYYQYQVVANGINSGLKRSHIATKSMYDDKPLNNANPYYYAVTAYAYSEYSNPKMVESDPQIIEVIPGLKPIDKTMPFQRDDVIVADKLSGVGDGRIELIVVDPNNLTGDEYRVVFNGEDDINPYSFINYTQNDTIIADSTNYIIDTANTPIIDGFTLRIHNDFWHARQDLPWSDTFIEQIVEIEGPGGTMLEPPVDVFQNNNSTGEWQVTTYHWPFEPAELFIQNINVSEAAGFHDYEIRFTSEGSQYYLTGLAGSFSPWRGNDPLASERVPFEIWDVGSTDSEDDDIRLTLKILDNYNTNQQDSILIINDNTWSQLENGNWEPIYAFLGDSVYQEPLPEESGLFPDLSVFKVGKIIISGSLPEEGTVIRLSTVKPLTSNDVFSVIATAPNTKDYQSAKTNLDEISVFPNPFFGTALYSGYTEQGFVRFTNLPTQATIRIFTIGGTYVRRIDKNDDIPWLDWDLKNNAGETVASGVYIAHLEMPNIGEKVMKIAVILENRQ